MEHEYRTVAGSELLEARKAAGASRGAVARELGVNTSTIWRWEKPDRDHGHIQAEKYLAAIDRVVRGEIA